MKREDIFCTSKVLCVLCVCICVQVIVPRWKLYNRIICSVKSCLVNYAYWYIPKVLAFPGGSVLKTWCFTVISWDSILGRGSNIPQATWYAPPKKKLTKVLLLQIFFLNLWSFGAHPFDQSWSDQPWKSHWKIFNWTMLISILCIIRWLWRLEICVITSMLYLVLECVSTCRDSWIKIFLSRLKGWLH